MAQDTSNQTPDSATPTSAKDIKDGDTKLVSFSSPPELNRRLEEFEASLQSLEQRLDSTRSTYEALTEVSGTRHEEMNDDLGRVQESLTSLQQGYERLGEQTKRIAAETGRLAISLSDNQEVSAEELIALKKELQEAVDQQARQSLEQQEAQLSRLNTLAQQAEELDQRGQELTSKLDQRSKDLDQRIEETEKALQTQMQQIADTTATKAIDEARQYTDASIEDQTSALNFELQQSSQSLRKEQQAAHAQLQDANESLLHRMEEQAMQLDKRIELESDARQQSEHIQTATNQRLEEGQTTQTKALANLRTTTEQDATKAKARADQLEHNHEQQTARVEVLDTRVSRENDRLSNRLDVFTDLIRTHHRQGMAALALVLLIVVAYAFYQDRALSEQTTRTDALVAETTQQMEDQQLRTNEALFLNTRIQDQAGRRTAALETQVQEQLAAQEKLAQEALLLKTQVAAQEQQIATLKDQLIEVKDQSDSVSGRVNGLVSSLDHFGGDNILHGPQWLAKQDADAWAIRLTTTPDRQSLYDLAQRYGHRLPEKLAYYPIKENGQNRYALIYGQYQDFAKATQQMFRAPRINLREPARVERIGDIQAKL